MLKKMPLFTKIGFDMAESRPRQVCDASWARVLTLRTRDAALSAPSLPLRSSLRGPAARRPAAQREGRRCTGRSRWPPGCSAGHSDLQPTVDGRIIPTAT